MSRLKCPAIAQRENTGNQPLVRPPIPDSVKVSEENVDGEKLIRPPNPKGTRGLTLDSSEDYPDIPPVNEGSKDNESLNEENNDQVKGIHNLH